MVDVEQTDVLQNYNGGVILLQYNYSKLIVVGIRMKGTLNGITTREGITKTGKETFMFH